MIQDIDMSWICFVHCNSGNLNSTVPKTSVRRRPNNQKLNNEG